MYKIVKVYEDPMWTHELQGTSDAPDPLDGAIEKWESIVRFLAINPEALVDSGSRWTCPLCWHYWEQECYGCSIREWTGKRQCKGTPHERYHDEPTLATASMELDFLVALRDWSDKTLYDMDEYEAAYRGGA